MRPKLTEANRSYPGLSGKCDFFRNAMEHGLPNMLCAPRLPVPFRGFPRLSAGQKILGTIRHFPPFSEGIRTYPPFSIFLGQRMARVRRAIKPNQAKSS